MDIYRAAKRRGKYPTLDTDTEVNSQGRSQKKIILVEIHLLKVSCSGICYVLFLTQEKKMGLCCCPTVRSALGLVQALT